MSLLDAIDLFSLYVLFLNTGPVIINARELFFQIALRGV